MFSCSRVWTPFGQNITCRPEIVRKLQGWGSLGNEAEFVGQNPNFLHIQRKYDQPQRHNSFYYRPSERTF